MIKNSPVTIQPRLIISVLLTAALMLSYRGYRPDEYPDITFNIVDKEKRIEAFYDCNYPTGTIGSSPGFNYS